MVIKAMAVDEIMQGLMTSREPAHGKNPKEHQQRWIEARDACKGQ